MPRCLAATPFRSVAIAAALVVSGLPAAALAAGADSKPDGFILVHAFPAADASGHAGGEPSRPDAPLLEQPDGSLLGVSALGGRKGRGTVFSLGRKGGVTTAFSATKGQQGATDPSAPPVRIDATTRLGTMAGTAYECGSIYTVGDDGRFQVLHRFSGYAVEGCHPSPLTEGDDGAFYGTARLNEVDDLYTGSVFKITRDGQFSIVYTFKRTDGNFPVALTKGNDGNFYGTTQGYGDYRRDGSVFRVTPDGVFTSLADLGGPLGANTYTPLLLASDGNFYGTTVGNGSYSGSVFRMTHEGVITRLLLPGIKNAAGPLIQASDGDLYGVVYDAEYKFTIIRRFSLAGVTTDLHLLNQTAEGVGTGGLTQGRDGHLYGYVSAGGPLGGGSLFRLRLDRTAR